jgi:hypothetical protein
MLVEDWRTSKSLFFGSLLLLIVTFVVAAYYMNQPKPEFSWDSPDYFDFASRMRTRGQLVDPHRLPGYPLFINLIFALTGQDNMVALGVAHAVLFILATLEIYVIALLIFRRGWAAFLLGLFVGTNLTLLTYVKLLLSETLALWLVVSLALATVLFVLTLRVRYLWLVTVFAFGLFFTRTEWSYLPVPLFAYFMLVATQRRAPRRRLLFHMLACVVLLYATLGEYIYINATQNNLVGIVDAQNINPYGKVLEYGMQNEAPPEYAAVARISNSYVARGDTNPYDIFADHPSLTDNNFALVGAYGRAIIIHHPVEFLAKSVPLALWSLTHFGYYDVSFSLSLTQFYHNGSEVDPNGVLGGPLVGLQSLFVTLYDWNMLFPLCAGLWILPLFWRRTARLRSVQIMGTITLLVFYDLVSTTLGGYEDFVRLSTPSRPLLFLVIWASILAVVILAVRSMPQMIAERFRTDNQSILPS